MAHFAASVFVQESGFSPTAVSNRGCVGIGQLSEYIANHYGVTDRTNASQNIDGSIHFLADNLRRWKRIDLAAAEYHAGYSNVYRAGGVPDTHDGGMATKDYVRAIQQRMAQWVSV